MSLSRHFARVNTRVTKVFKLRLQWACEKRQQETARRATEGEILSEMKDHLEPHPEEANGASPTPKKRGPKSEGRKKRAKASVA
jgi:hypothetical protein